MLMIRNQELVEEILVMTETLQARLGGRLREPCEAF